MRDAIARYADAHNAPAEQHSTVLAQARGTMPANK